MGARYGTGSFYIESLRANFKTPSGLSGHSDCSESLIVNCGSVTAAFAFLVIALGVLIFGIYATVQRRRAHPGEPKPEKVFVDREGWETKVSDEEGWETKVFDNEEGWETKDED